MLKLKRKYLHKVREFANFRPPFIRWALLPRLVLEPAPSATICARTCLHIGTRVHEQHGWTRVFVIHAIFNRIRNFLRIIDHREPIHEYFFIRIGEEITKDSQ